MTVYCLNCGKPLATPDKNHPKGRVKCSGCKVRYKYALTENGLRVDAKGKNLSCNRSLDIMETSISG